jgi:hypothetical protein
MSSFGFSASKSEFSKGLKVRRFVFHDEDERAGPRRHKTHENSTPGVAAIAVKNDVRNGLLQTEITGVLHFFWNLMSGGQAFDPGRYLCDL